MTQAEWTAEAERRFGADPMAWRFVCPSCSHVASVRDWKDAGAPGTAVAFSCVGWWTGADDAKSFGRTGGPCQYAGGGLFQINPVTVDCGGKPRTVFDFAP